MLAAAAEAAIGISESDDDPRGKDAASRPQDAPSLPFPWRQVSFARPLGRKRSVAAPGAAGKQAVSSKSLGTRVGVDVCCRGAADGAMNLYVPCHPRDGLGLACRQCGVVILRSVPHVVVGLLTTTGMWPAWRAGADPEAAIPGAACAGPHCRHARWRGSRSARTGPADALAQTRTHEPASCCSPAHASWRASKGGGRSLSTPAGHGAP